MRDYPNRRRIVLKKAGIAILGLAFFIFEPSPSKAQIGPSGGLGLLRVYSAETVLQGDLYLNAFGSTFLKKVGNALAKDYTFSVSVTYGLLSFLELDSRFVLYQDDQKHLWGPIGDTEMGFKLKIPTGGQRIFHIALRNFIVLPTAVTPDPPYESFSSDGLAWSSNLCLTLDFSDVVPVLPFKIFLNAGYIDHDVRDRVFLSKKDQLLYGAGFKVSLLSMVFYSELNTEQFLNRRSELSFRENHIRWAQGLVFAGPLRTIWTLAVDWSLTRDDPNTKAVPKEYADWKVYVGLTYHIPLQNYFSEIAAERERRKELERERKRQEKIREQRQRAQEELKRLEEILKKKKEKPE